MVLAKKKVAEILSANPKLLCNISGILGDTTCLHWQEDITSIKLDELLSCIHFKRFFFLQLTLQGITPQMQQIPTATTQGGLPPAAAVAAAAATAKIQVGFFVIDCVGLLGFLTWLNSSTARFASGELSKYNFFISDFVQ